MQLFAPPGSYHTVLHFCLHVFSHCFVLVVKPALCGGCCLHEAPAWVATGVAMLSHVAFPQAPCCPQHCGGFPRHPQRMGTFGTATPDLSVYCGGESPASRQRDTYERAAPRLLAAPVKSCFLAIFACCRLLYVLIQSSGNSWVKEEIENVMQSKLQ